MTKIPNQNLLDLSGKTAIVTGGAMGIGLGISERLAEAGAKVLIADLNIEEANKSAEKLSQQNFKVKAVQTDVSSEEDVANMVKTAISEFGSVDILVNNAGIFPNIPILKLNLEDFEKIIHVNLRSVFLSTKYASEQMIAQGNGGRIINITSIDALHPSMVGLATYDASKHGVWGFTKNAALELSEHKIWVNAVAPGGIITPGATGTKQSTDIDMAKAIEAFLQKIPMHRMGEADEIGKVVLFLASEMSSYMTGSQIVVDGGALLS